MAMMKELLETPGDNSGGGLTVDNIFETLSRDKPEEKIIDKPEADDDKEDEPEEEINILDEADEEESEDEEDQDDEEDDEKEEDKEEIEIKEDEEDEIELSKIPTRAQLKAKYPNIFKDIPALDHIIYREKAYAELFPTIKDAKQAQAAVSSFNQLQEDVLSGEVVPLLKQIKQTNSKAYDKIANNIINSLIEVDKDSYIEPARMVIKTALFNVNQLASAALKKDPNNKRAEQLQIASELLSEQLFNESEVTPYRALKDADKKEEENPELLKLRQERQNLQQERFREAHGKVSNKFNDLVTKTILNNVDKKNVLTPYVKNQLTRDIKEELDKQLLSDKRFGQVVQKLYERAAENGFSEAALDNILTALKNKAGSILQSIIVAKKGEALKGTSSVKSAKIRELSRERSGDTTTRNSGEKRNSSTRSEKGKESDEPQPYESVFDYLNRKLG